MIDQAILDQCYSELSAVLWSYLPSPGDGPMRVKAVSAVCRALECATAEMLVTAYGLDAGSHLKASMAVAQFQNGIAMRVNEVRHAKRARG